MGAHKRHKTILIPNEQSGTQIEYFEDKNSKKIHKFILGGMPTGGQGISKITTIRNGVGGNVIVANPGFPVGVGVGAVPVGPFPVGYPYPYPYPGAIPIITARPPAPFWAPSGSWSSCTKPCGGGTQIKTYVCKELDKCSGFQQRQRMCNLKKCKKNLDDHLSNLQKVASGKWEYLGNWSPCSQKCGFEGSQTIKRICVNGKCLGKKETVAKPCNIKACPSDDKKKNKNIFSQCKNLLGEFDLFNGSEIIHAVVEVNMKNIEFYRKQSSMSEYKSPFLVLTNSDMIKFSKSKKSSNCLNLNNYKSFGVGKSDKINMKILKKI